jgi:hypothetical protein
LGDSRCGADRPSIFRPVWPVRVLVWLRGSAKTWTTANNKNNKKSSQKTKASTTVFARVERNASKQIFYTHHPSPITMNFRTTTAFCFLLIAAVASAQEVRFVPWSEPPPPPPPHSLSYHRHPYHHHQHQHLSLSYHRHFGRDRHRYVWSASRARWDPVACSGWMITKVITNALRPPLPPLLEKK